MKKNYLQNVVVVIAVFMISITSVKAQTLLDEDFTGKTAPAGWTSISTTDEPYKIWTFFDEFDDLEIEQSYKAPQNEWYITPSLDLSTKSDMYLTFSLWLYGKYNAVIGNTFDVKVNISSDNGATWTVLWSDDELTADSFQADYFYDRSISKSLASYTGPGFGNVKIGFQFTSKGVVTETTYNAAYLMGVKVSTSCPGTSFDVLSPTAINWFPISGFSGTYEIEYGPYKFTPGTGTLLTGLTGSTYTIPSTMCSYDVYIRTNCGGTKTEWLKTTYNNFVDNIVNAPTSNSNAITWTGSTSNYDIEYGPKGFTAGTGTFIKNISGKSYTIKNLQPNTNYSVLIRSNCGSSIGFWRGSNFTTTTLAINNINFIENLTIYPNPSQNFVNIKANPYQIDSIELFDLQGRSVLTNVVNASEFNVDIQQFSNGTYFMKINSNSASKVVKIIKN